MGEDMTYPATMTLADWRQRARELEAWRNACPYSAERLRVNQAYLRKYPIAPDELRTIFGAFAEWLEKAPATQPAQPDDTDAPLKLAAIDDEDGDL